MNSLVIIPTYNEKDNIKALINEIFNVEQNISILVVDDNSPDGTLDIVKEIANIDKRIHYLSRQNKNGLASAYIDGFKWGIANGYDILCEMDADFSHNPKYLKDMLKQIEHNDFVIGSRNIKGGAVIGWGFLRNFISKMGTLYSRFILKMIPIYDLTGGYNMWRKSTLEKIGLDNIISQGYLFQIEMKYKAWIRGCTFVEIPIVFEDRKYGKSKFNLNIFIEALTKIWKIR